MESLEAEITRLQLTRDLIDKELKTLQQRLAHLNSVENLPNNIPPSYESNEKTGCSLSVLPAPVDLSLHTKTLTKESSLEDKYALFLSLFGGRSDMHAKRFYSEKSKSSGYSPVCANAFKPWACTMGGNKRTRIKCVNCENQAFSEISLREFEDHITGKKKDNSDVLAAYSIDQDNTCSFIVADFDSKEESLIREKSLDGATLAFLKTARDASLPVYLERSRSGKGYHAWLFFESRISARLARRLYSTILTAAMNNSPELSFDSYDRFIPHQDTIPYTGFGSMIALPLQGAAGKQGHSVFLDEHLNYYPDQWEFLSKIKRLSEKEVKDAIASFHLEDDLGDLIQIEPENPNPLKPWEKKRPETSLSKNDFTGTVDIILANMVFVPRKNLSTRAQNRIIRLTAFPNKEFYDRQKKHQGTWEIPRIISTAEITEEYICLPRGTQSSLLKLLEKSGASFILINKSQAGLPLKASFKGTLRDKQSAAVKALLAHNTGVLSAHPGFGKTVLGIKLIAERAVNTLILVNNRNLLTQWKNQLNALLAIENEPPLRYTPTGREKRCPQIGAYYGSHKIVSGLVDIATFQSLCRKGDLPDFVKDYGMVIVDECHHIPAATFEMVLKAINATYVYGLSATLDRRDGHEEITFMQCGPIRYDAGVPELPFGQFVVPRFTTACPDNLFSKDNFTKIQEDLIADGRRNELIVNDVVAAYNRGRHPLVLTQRTDHVSELAQLIRPYVNNVLEITGKATTVEKDAFQNQIRGMGKKERCIIIATGAYIGEGFDFSRLDTLFLALPISGKTRVTQYTGRLHRLYEGKKRVEVYDYVDVRVPMLEGMYRKRLRAYKQVGYKVALQGAELEAEGIIYGAENFRKVFKNDCATAAETVTICSPYLTSSATKTMLTVFKKLCEQKVVITVFTRYNKKSSTVTKQRQTKIVHLLEDAGANVIAIEDFALKCAAIDKRVVWYGGLDLLGSSEKDEGAIRIVDSEVAEALLEQAELVKGKGESNE